jgi:hypothetical protein
MMIIQSKVGLLNDDDGDDEKNDDKDDDCGKLTEDLHPVDFERDRFLDG